jgi:excisionase family DNA binding protein
MADPLHRVRQALEAHRQTLQVLEDALLELEEPLPKKSGTADDSNGRLPQLLSIDELCEVLGMGRSWIYRRLKSGEIPSVKLGRSIKVKRQDLEEYLESRRYRPAEQEQQLEEGE